MAMRERIFPNMNTGGFKETHGVQLGSALHGYLGRQGVGMKELRAGHNTTTKKNPMKDRVGKKGDHGKGRGTRSFRTPSGGVSANARRAAESKGDAMPGGRFPIRNLKDLSNAKHDFGRANDKPAVRAFIDKRARALGGKPLGSSKGKGK